MTNRPRGGDVGELYDRFAAGLYRYALMILADPAAAADAVQQVFMGLLRRQGADVNSDERYLRRSVRNECFSTLRRRQHEPKQADGVILLESVSGRDSSPEERLALQQVLASLPPEQREVVHLKTFEGMTFQEIADLLDESINTVASRYRYAIEKLRTSLGVRL